MRTFKRPHKIRKSKDLPFPLCSTPTLARVLGSYTRAYAVQRSAILKKPLGLRERELKELAQIKQGSRFPERPTPDGQDPTSIVGAAQKSAVDRQVTPDRTLAGSIAA